VIGVRIGIGGHVEVVGKNERWVQEQAERFVRQVARYGFARPLCSNGAKAEHFAGENARNKVSLEAPLLIATAVHGSGAEQIVVKRPVGQTCPLPQRFCGN
jgi:hypothetical protein